MKTLAQTTKAPQKPGTITPSGFILWRGLSPHDGATIVAIATIKSANSKTGNMVQTWILRDNINPVDALKLKQDDSICGSCKFKSGGGCYVNVGQAPNAIYKAYKAGKYPLATSEDRVLIGSGRMVRVGAYGDPAMVPYHIWWEVLKNSKGHTGYTHQYDNNYFDPRMLTLCMASADTLEQASKLNDAGYRTFTAIGANEGIPSDQLVCPNTTKGIQCRDCGLCNGSKGNGKSIIVEIHGTQKAKFKLNRG